MGTLAGEAWILAEDEAMFRAPSGPIAEVRLLPSGDAFWLAWGVDRELLVPDIGRREQLWTSRVWPGALLVRGEFAGVWRRSGLKVTMEFWRRLSVKEREAVESEVALLPLAGSATFEGKVRAGRRP